MPTQAIQPGQPVPPLTEFARKYGVSKFSTFQSGLTPNATRFPALMEQNLPSNNAYQRRRLYGFTTEELARKDCLPIRELKPGNLQNRIIDVLKRENWEKRAIKPRFTYHSRTSLYKMRNGNGYWTMANDEAWKVMEPCLILASRMVMSAHTIPWFDALLNGPRTLIDDSRKDINDMPKPGWDDLTAFHPVAAFSPAAADPAPRLALLTKLQKDFKCRFAFMDHDESPVNPTKAPPPDCYALTTWNDAYMRRSDNPNKEWRVFIWVDCHMVEPLLRTDINSADRMMIQWHVANSIVHELIHALFEAQDLPGPSLYDHELFFEDEPIAEVGFSFEAAINRGATDPFVANSKKLPMGFWHRRYTCTYDDVDLEDDAMISLSNPGPPLYDEFFPVPISAWEDMQQENFWNIAVRQFGHGILHFRSPKEGSKCVYQVKDQNKRRLWEVPRLAGSRGQHIPNHIPEQETFRNTVEAMEDAMSKGKSMTPDERNAMHFGRFFLSSSSAEETIWDNSQEQQRRVDGILSVLTTVTMDLNVTISEKQGLIGNLSALIQKAIENHEIMIAAILSAENLAGIFFYARRANLLIWNRGTRVFLNQLSRVPGLATTFDQQLLDLERARMYLFNPNDLASGLDTDNAELQLLQLADSQAQQGQVNECLATCQLVLGDMDMVSPIASIAAFLLGFDMMKDDPVAWMTRNQRLKQILPKLDYLLPAATHPWYPFVQSLKTKAARSSTHPQPLNAF